LIEISSGCTYDSSTEFVQWKFAIAPKAVSSTTKSKSTSDNAEIIPGEGEFLNCLREHNILSSDNSRLWRGLPESKNLAELRKMPKVARSVNLFDEVDAENFMIRFFRFHNSATRLNAFSDISPIIEMACSDFFLSQSKQKWLQWMPICSEGKPLLQAPEPDHAAGLFSQNQDYFWSVYKSFAGYATPGICEMMWILLTVEISDRSTESNALNVVIAVNNILQLKKAI